MERRLLILTAIFAAAALATLRVEMAKKRPSSSKLPTLPVKVGNWQGKRIALSREELEILGADNVEFMRYHDSSGQSIGLCVVSERRKRASFHPPEYCYLAQSNVSIVGRERAFISLNGGRIEASTMTLRMGETRTLVLYWYRSGSYRTPSYYAHQLSFLWRIFLWGGSDSTMVRLTTPVGDEGVEGALKRIEDFLKDLVPCFPAL